uniref:Ig-like domain-containing protein n=1 Tax=Neogobius melanostomus TaxID=47308 RepID=A0A8C6TIC9_9GOBI
MESALCTLLSALVVLLCSSPECKGEDTVTQPEGDASVFKGHTATINCTFETTDRTPYLFWYKQEGHGVPQYMMRKMKSSSGWTKALKSTEFDESRFEFEAEGNSVYLQIQDVSVSDSAVYYCALRPTVTGNTKI